MHHAKREISSHTRCMTPPLMWNVAAGPQLVGNEHRTMAQNRKRQGILRRAETTRTADGSNRRWHTDPGVWVLQNIQPPLSRVRGHIFWHGIGIPHSSRSGSSESALTSQRNGLKTWEIHAQKWHKQEAEPVRPWGPPAMGGGTGREDFLATLPQWALPNPADGDKSHHCSREGLKQCGHVQIFSRLLSWRICLMPGGLNHSFQSVHFWHFQYISSNYTPTVK